MVLPLGAESSASRVSLAALMESVHSDRAIPPRQKQFLLMCGNDQNTMEWRPFQPKQWMIYSLPHHENECQWSVNNLWACVLGSQAIAWTYELITELLTAFIGKNKMYTMKNTDSKTIAMANCKPCNKRLLAAEYMILVTYYYQTAEARAVYESTDGLAGQLADILANSDMLRELHQIILKLPVRVYWQPGLPIWPWFGPDPEPLLTLCAIQHFWLNIYFDITNHKKPDFFWERHSIQTSCPCTCMYSTLQTLRLIRSKSYHIGTMVTYGIMNKVRFHWNWFTA